MGASTDKIKKLRTFLTDIEHLNPSTKVEQPVQTTELKTSNLPPIFSEKKAEPIISVPVNTRVTKTDSVKTLPDQNQIRVEPNLLQPSSVTKPILSGLPIEKAGSVNEKISQTIEALPPLKPDYQTEKLSVMDTDNEITEGTIITDKKRDRFNLLPAMAEAIKLWFFKGKEKIEKRREEKRLSTPTVTPIENRKDILQKAARQVAQAPKDDYKKLTETLPTSIDTNKVVKNDPLSIIEKAPVTEPSWQYYENAENKTGESPTLNEEVETLKPTETSIPGAPVKEPLLAPRLAPLPNTTVSPIKPDNSASALVSDVKVEPVEIVIKNEPKKAVARQWKASPQSRQTGKLLRIIFYSSSVVVAVGAIWGGVTLSTWMFGSTEGLTATTPLNSSDNTGPTSLIRSDRETELLLTRSRDDFYEGVLSATQGLGGINVIVPTTNGVTGETTASTDILLDTLNWQASLPLLRSISEINFGTLGAVPFVVIRVTAFDTALGGLLMAEANMSNDFAPLFGDIVTASFAITEEGGGLRPPYFEDDVVKNHDVRVLKDETEAERIVYGFVNQNTVIITTDRGAFAALADLIR